MKTMITYEQARQLAIAQIKSHEELIRKEHPDDSLVLEHSSEFDNGWLFFFNSKLFLETHNVVYRFMGLGPVIIGKKRGEVYQSGSGGNEGYWIDKFNEHVKNNYP
jgi:hypothetical protein